MCWRMAANCMPPSPWKITSVLQKSTKNTYSFGKKAHYFALSVESQKTIVFNISTEFYTEYTPFGENPVENSVESVDKCGFL